MCRKPTFAPTRFASTEKARQLHLYLGVNTEDPFNLRGSPPYASEVLDMPRPAGAKPISDGEAVRSTRCDAEEALRLSCKDCSPSRRPRCSRRDQKLRD